MLPRPMNLSWNAIVRPRTWFDWIHFSGATVCVTVNPLHWRALPKVLPEPKDVWAGPRERTWRVAWLMVTITVWIDDGSW